MVGRPGEPAQPVRDQPVAGRACSRTSGPRNSTPGISAAGQAGLTFNQYGGSVGDRSSVTGSSCLGFTRAIGSGRSAWFRQPSGPPGYAIKRWRRTPSYKLYLDQFRYPISRWALTTTRGSISTQPLPAVTTITRISRVTSGWAIPAIYLSPTAAAGRIQLLPRHYINGANDRTFRIWDERGTVSYITGGAGWTSESRFGYHLTDMQREDAFFFQQLDPNNKTEQCPSAGGCPA